MRDYDLEEFRYVRKFPFVEYKIKEIYRLLDKDKVQKAFRGYRMLVEVICLVILQKKYNVRPCSSMFSMLAAEFSNLGDEKLSQLLISSNGKMNFLLDNGEVGADHVETLLYDVDDLLAIIIHDYQDVVGELDEEAARYY